MVTLGWQDSSLDNCAVWFDSFLFVNPADRFSRDVVHFDIFFSDKVKYYL